MRVEAARVLEIALPLRKPFVLSDGEMSVRRSLIVELRDADGRIGHGEAAPFELPFYSEETLAASRVLITEVLLPRLIGTEVSSPPELHQLLTEGIRGHHFARAGVETAWWHLRSVVTGRPLHQLVATRLQDLGVPAAQTVPTADVKCGVALGVMDAPHLENECVEATRSGYHRLKLKVRPGWCVEPVEIAVRIREETGTDLDITVDGNGAFDPVRDEAELRELAAHPLAFIEQPFPAELWMDAWRFEQETGCSVCLDESLVSDALARQVELVGGPLTWNLKVQRLGGIEETCRVFARGLRIGARMWVGTMPESGLGAQAALIFAALPGVAFPTDVEPSRRWYAAGTDVLELEMNRSGVMRGSTDLTLDLSRAEEIWSG